MDTRRDPLYWCLMALGVGLFCLAAYVVFDACAKPFLVTSAQANPTGPLTTNERYGSDSSKTATPIPDVVWEEHLLRQVFDSGYVGQHHLGDQLAKPELEEWEAIYFGRDLYRQRFTAAVSKNWATGPMFWQARVHVRVPDELKRGGPIIFELRYPLIEFRKPFRFTVVRNDEGATLVNFDRPYHTPRLSYLIGGLLTIVGCALLAIVLVAVGLFLWHVWNVLVNVVAGYVTQGQTSSPWARRFASCLVGAALCVVVSIVAFIAR